MELQKALEKRASVKKYISKKPPLDKVMEGILAANTAPTPGNLQILKYVIIENPESISKIADACQQSFIKQVPYVVIICSETRQMKRLYDKRAEKYLKQYVGAAAQNFLLKMTELGLASCWVGAFVESTIRQLIDLPEDVNIELLITVGYPLGKPAKQKYKHTLINKVFSEGWNTKYKPFIRVRRGDV